MSDAKTRFLQAGERLFRRQGYAGSGLKELIKEAQAPSGSLYYYFPDGKTQLGVEALGYAATFYADGLRAAFEHFADRRRAPYFRERDQDSPAVGLSRWLSDRLGGQRCRQHQ
jgi:AcrR family transcriptional regulator